MQGAGQRAVVIGGGIGGLAAALALRRAGWEVAVYEQAPALREVGAGLRVSPNGMHVLERLGLAERVLEQCVVVRREELCNWRGRVLAGTDTVPLYERLGAPGVLVLHGVLYGLLREALGESHLHLGARLVGYDDMGPQVEVAFVDGRRAVGELLVGADGLRSVVREYLHPADSLDYVGYACWRGLSPPLNPPELPPGLLRETQGRGARFGAGHVTREGRVSWWATVNVPYGWQPPRGDKAFLLEIFGAVHAPVRELLESTAEQEMLRGDILDRMPLSRWGEGRVTLLGDAAHPMTPDLGQGANAALEDAAALAQALAQAADVEQGLRQYEDQRVQRTAWLQRNSRRFGAVAQWEDPPAVWLREQLLQRVPERWMVREYERLWRWA